jgi:bifunctional non-homologous end joining protein LigD
MAAPPVPSTTIRPMLPTAGPLPSGPGWAFEFAWDGLRTLADVGSGRVRLIGVDQGLVAGYPELDVLACLGNGRRMVLDGTIVALDAYGRPSQSRLNRRMSTQQPSKTLRRRLPVSYYVFDLLRFDDLPTHQLPYHRRREILEGLDLPGGAVALAPSFPDIDGQAVLDTAAQYGLPGVIAKRARSRYQPGRRSRSWVHTSVHPTQDVVIGGWVSGARGVGSLLVGVPTECGLHLVGQVGVGFTEADRRALAARLSGIERRTSPFVGFVAAPAGVRWVAPDLLGEVGFRRWTVDGRLGHPVWLGLRPNKHPAAVQRPPLLGTPRLDQEDDQTELDELDEAVRKAQAEVEALRTRISPHFLYNVLNTITSYVRTDPPLARELLVEFAVFTRYSFRSDVTTSTLAEELDNVQRYLKLEKARFGDRLLADVQVPPGALALTVPFLALQLAVEHTVQHGIETRPGGGTLTIRAVEHRRDCVVTVSDSATTTTPIAGGGLGGSASASAANSWRLLRILDDRLRATYGDQGALLVEAITGGTRLTFRIPRSR